MKIWIARVKSGLLYLHEKKPTTDGDYWYSSGSWSLIEFDLFPEVTFENSPQEIEIKLI